MAIMGSSIAFAFCNFYDWMVLQLELCLLVPIFILYYTFLALASIFVLLKFVPNPPHITHTYKEKAKLGEIFRKFKSNQNEHHKLLQKGLMTLHL